MPDVIGQSIAECLKKYVSEEVFFMDTVFEIMRTIEFCRDSSIKLAEFNVICDSVDSYKFKRLTLSEAVSKIKALIDV